MSESNSTKILKKPLPNNPHQAPLYIVAYDISDNKERAKVDKVLHNFGFRVQKSVYECRLTRAGKKQLLGQLENLALNRGISVVMRCSVKKLPKLVIYRLILMSIFTLWSKIVKKLGREMRNGGKNGALLYSLC